MNMVLFWIIKKELIEEEKKAAWAESMKPRSRDGHAFQHTNWDQFTPCQFQHSDSLYSFHLGGQLTACLYHLNDQNHPTGMGGYGMLTWGKRG